MTVLERIKTYEPIFNEYRIIKEIGTGNFSVVFEVFKTATLPNKSALKVIPLNNDDINEMGKFKQEVDILKQLPKHENIVNGEKFDIRMHPDTNGVDLLILMELFESNIQHVMKKKDYIFTENEVIKIGISLCNALEVIHGVGIIHRDIKPENVLISSAGEYKLADFGIAKKSFSAITSSSRGTPIYAAPEVIRMERINPRCDIYSLGLMMYVLLNGNRFPFEPENATGSQLEAALGKRVRGDEMPKPSTETVKYPYLAETILKAIHHNPLHRYENATAMKEVLLLLLKINNGLENENALVPLLNLPQDDDKNKTIRLTERATTDDILRSTERATSDPPKRNQPVPVEAPPTQTPTTQTKPHKKPPNLTKAVVILSVALVLVIASGIFMLVRDRFGTGTDYIPAYTEHNPINPPAYTEHNPIDPPPQQTIAVGDIIPFGGYDWLVLDVQDNHALILTENIIEKRPYNISWDAVTWETSNIRRFLNGTFIYRLSQADRNRIRETTVINSSNPWTFIGGSFPHNTPGGRFTQDKIFLLSIEEVANYFGGSVLLELGENEGNREGSIMGLYTWGIWENNDISDARIAQDATGTVIGWWLRSPGRRSNDAAYITTEGSINISGHRVDWSEFGVRPALWLNLES
jgi:serine/threonine protein kinase